MERCALCVCSVFVRVHVSAWARMHLVLAEMEARIDRQGYVKFICVWKLNALSACIAISQIDGRRACEVCGVRCVCERES